MAASPEPITSAYLHGSTPEEQRRLSLLNDLLNPAALRAMDLQGGEHILDVGSGLGQFSRQMARAAGEQGRIVGVERDEAQLATARRLTEADAAAGNVTFRPGDARRLPLDDAEWGSFDMAHARFLLEHVPDPEQVVAQMVRALKPGGRLILTDDDHSTFRLWPEPPGFAPLWHAYERSYDRLGNDPFIGRRLPALLLDAGLRSLRITGLFFGGCAGDATFDALAENLIGVLAGARPVVVGERLLDADSFLAALDGLAAWKQHPAAALWYTICWAEGRLPVAAI